MRSAESGMQNEKGITGVYERAVHKAYKKRAMLEREVREDVKKLSSELGLKVGDAVECPDALSELRKYADAIAIYVDILDEAKDEYELCASEYAEARYKQQFESD